MSAYLAPYFDQIPLGYTTVQMQNTFVGNLVANGWQLLAQVDGDHSDLIPPATEAIGTATFREVVRIYFPNNTTVVIGSYQVCIADAYAQSFRLSTLTAGAVQAGVTIQGVTVLGAVGSVGTSANDNLKALFYALKDSVDATITGWDYWYDGAGTLIGTRKTIAAAVTVSGNANVTYSALGAPVLAGARSGFVNVDTNYAYPITVDLTNGFVYYMEIYSRSFSLSAKCLSGVTGPVFATYVDHAQALNGTPSGNCTPMELWVGKFVTGTTNLVGYAKPTHWYGRGNAYSALYPPSTEASSTAGYTTYQTMNANHPFSGVATPFVVTDVGNVFVDNGLVNGTGGVVFSWQYPLVNDRGPITTVSVDGSKIRSIGVLSRDFVPYAAGGAYVCEDFSGECYFSDLHYWFGSEPNEASAMSVQVSPPGVNGLGLTLQQDLDATTAYTSILFNGVVGLSAMGGAFVIGTEEFTYTGLSGGNTATGVLRSQNGTTGARHFVNDVVQPVLWFLKVNNSAICCGSNKPV